MGLCLLGNPLNPHCALNQEAWAYSHLYPLGLWSYPEQGLSWGEPYLVLGLNLLFQFQKPGQFRGQVASSFWKSHSSSCLPALPETCQWSTLSSVPPLEFPAQMFRNHLVCLLPSLACQDQKLKLLVLSLLCPAPELAVEL